MKRNIRTIIKNEYIFSIITKFIIIAISLMQSIVVARYLGASLLGSRTYISSIVSILSIIITFGMHQAYPYLKKIDSKKNIIEDYMSIMYILYILYFILCLAISVIFFESLELKIAIAITPLYGYECVVGYVLLVEEPNMQNKWWTAIMIVDIIIICLLMLLLNESINIIIFILTFPILLKSIVFTRLLNIKPHYHVGQLTLLKKLFKIGFLPMLALLMTTLNYKIDIIMLRNFDCITIDQIGIYAIGISFADKIVLIPDTLKGVLVSKLSKGANESEVAKVSRLCFGASILICMGLLFFGSEILDVLYGTEYKGAYGVLLTCSWGSIFVGYFKLIAQYNIVYKKQIRNIVMLSLSVAINLILNIILIPKYELYGAAFASGVGYFLTGIIFVIWFINKTKIPVKDMFILTKKDFEYLSIKK